MKVGLSLILVMLVSVEFSFASPAQEVKENWRKVESVLLLGNGAATVVSILRKRLRRIGVPAAAIMGAAAYTLRLVRLINASDEEVEERRYAIALNAAFIPLSILGATKGINAFAEGWRSLLPFAVNGGGTWRDKLVSLNWLVSVGIYGVTDTLAHIKHGRDILTSREWWINRFYTVFGAILTANALQRSGTLLGRVEGTLVMSAAYALFNSLVQELFWLGGGKDTDYRHLKFDQGWGLFHSAPRNLIDWTIWNHLASKVSNIQSAAWVGSLLSTLRLFDSLQRADWYANAKLDYLEHRKNFFRALKDNLRWLTDKSEKDREEGL